MKIKKDIEGTIIFKVPEFSHISETFILKQVIFAIELGYEVKILVRRLIPENQWAKSDKIEQDKLRDRIIVEDFRIPPNKFSRLIMWIQIFFFELKNLIPLVKYHMLKPKFSLTWLYEWNFYKKLNDVSLFHIQYGTNKYPLDQLKEVGYKPNIICSFHGHDAVFPIHGYIENDKYYDLLFKNAKSVVVNTPYLKQNIKDLNCPSQKIMQIPVSVDTKKFRLIKKVKKSAVFRLITVGRLNKSKGHIYMLKAIQKIISDVQIKLIIVGDGPERFALDSYINQNNLQNYVFLVGAKSQDEIVKLHHNSDLFLFTSEVPLNKRMSTETQGLAISEAMSCGLPVICFDSGGVRFTFEHNKSGFLILDNNVSFLVQRILELNQNRDLLRDMGKEARIFTQANYSDDMIRAKWKTLYTEMV